MTKKLPLAVALSAFAMACSDPSSPTTRSLSTSAPSLDILTPAKSATPPVAFGSVELCKTSNVAGSFGFTTSTTAASGSRLDEGTPDVTITVGAGGGTVCKTVYSGSTLPNVGGADAVTIVELANAATLQNIDIVQYLHPDPDYGAPLSAPRLDDSENEGTRTAVAKINSDMSRRVTFTNFTAPPPPPVCDFITFGRLVWEHDGLKVVISGNAGGNSPDGGFLNEFHIEVNGVDHHVADITSYGPIAAAPLATSTYANSRRAAGLDKHGHAVELRVWDGGEPGWKFDRFWFNVNGTIVGHATTGNLVDQGNMQYHPNCRGPGN